MAHDYLSSASFREENSRSRFTGANFSRSHRKTPGICECTRTEFALQGIFQILSLHL